MRLLIATLLCGALAGCGTPPAPELRPVHAPRSAQTQATLVAEQKRLADLFRGTPVVFAMQPDGILRVEVPLRYCFDAGRDKVKPPLAAVLDRLAASQRNAATQMLVSAPTDPGAKGLALATRRAVSVRGHMVEKGVAATRFSIAAIGHGAAVSILVGDAPPP